LPDLLPWEFPLYAAAGAIVLTIIYMILKLARLFGGRLGNALKLVSAGFLFFAVARTLQSFNAMGLIAGSGIGSPSSFRGALEVIYFMGLVLMAGGFYRFLTLYGKR